MHRRPDASILCVCVYTYAFSCFIDVARWVLNNQIIYESSTGKITYHYDLIDDFDPDNCDFNGPLTHLLRRIKPLRRSVDQVDSMPPVAGNPQYNSLNDNDSNRSGTYDQKPTKYDSKNHMLNVMVSREICELSLLATSYLHMHISFIFISY